MSHRGSCWQDRARCRPTPAAPLPAPRTDLSRRLGERGAAQAREYRERETLRLARSKAELVRTTVVIIVLACQILAVLRLYGVT